MYPSSSTQQPAAICALKSPADAYVTRRIAFLTILTCHSSIHILEAVRLGIVPRVTRRLTGHERSMIRPGTVWVWEEGKWRRRRSSSQGYIMTDPIFQRKRICAVGRMGVAGALRASAVAASSSTPSKSLHAPFVAPSCACGSHRKKVLGLDVPTSVARRLAHVWQPRRLLCQWPRCFHLDASTASRTPGQANVLDKHDPPCHGQG